MRNLDERNVRFGAEESGSNEFKCGSIRALLGLGGGKHPLVPL